MSDQQIDAIAYMVRDLGTLRPRWWRWGQWVFTRRYTLFDLTIIYLIYRFFINSQLIPMVLVCVVGGFTSIWAERYFKLRPPMRRKSNASTS